MLRRIAQIFQPRSLLSLHAGDLEDARHGLREAILCSEAWEAQEVLYRSRIERLERELKCPATLKSKAPLSEDGPSGEWESHFAALSVGVNGLSYGDLSRASTFDHSHAAGAGSALGASESQAASSPPRASFLSRVGQKPSK